MVAIDQLLKAGAGAVSSTSESTPVTPLPNKEAFTPRSPRSAYRSRNEPPSPSIRSLSPLKSPVTQPGWPSQQSSEQRNSLRERRRHVRASSLDTTSFIDYKINKTVIPSATTPAIRPPLPASATSSTLAFALEEAAIGALVLRAGLASDIRAAALTTMIAAGMWSVTAAWVMTATAQVILACGLLLILVSYISRRYSDQHPSGTGVALICSRFAFFLALVHFEPNLATLVSMGGGGKQSFKVNDWVNYYYNSIFYRRDGVDDFGQKQT